MRHHNMGSTSADMDMRCRIVLMTGDLFVSNHMSTQIDYTRRVI